jgi:hypothetical protein
MPSPLEDELKVARFQQAEAQRIGEWNLRYGFNSDRPNTLYEVDPPDSHRLLVEDFLSKNHKFDWQVAVRVPSYEGASKPESIVFAHNVKEEKNIQGCPRFRMVKLQLSDDKYDATNLVLVTVLENGKALSFDWPNNQWGTSADFAKACIGHLLKHEESGSSSKTGSRRAGPSSLRSRLFGRRN